VGLLGSAALAMWWEIAPEVREEFGHWHSHEHFPERLSLPGFRRASRWVDEGGGSGVFVLYELESHEVLSSPAYVARLNAPTPWSTRLMPHHRQMVRCQCRVLQSEGGGVAGFAGTLRVQEGSTVDAAALQTMLKELARTPGLAGAHWLRHQAPPLATTTEQRIRGGDAVADHVLLVVGYERDAVAAAGARLERTSPGATPQRGLFRLAQSAVAGELDGIAP